MTEREIIQTQKFTYTYTYIFFTTQIAHDCKEGRRDKKNWTHNNMTKTDEDNLPILLCVAEDGYEACKPQSYQDQSSQSVYATTGTKGEGPSNLQSQ